MLGDAEGEATPPGDGAGVLHSQPDLSKQRMVDSVKGVRRIAAKLMHFDGAYLRFVGDLQISRYHCEELVETYKDQAIWELMYFGHPR